MDKVVEALKKLLPEDQVKEVSTAVNEMIDAAKKSLEDEANQKLEDAYAQLAKEMSEAEQVGYQGYQEALAIINDLHQRLEMMPAEYDKEVEKEYGVATEMLKQEREKNQKLEADLYEEYEKKSEKMQSYFVDKIHEFLQSKGGEIYEQAKRDIINDPRMAEHKVALDKIVNITSNYLSDEDYALATSSKLDEMKKEMENMKGQLRIMEGRNIRLSTKNTKLNEGLRDAKNLITENKNHKQEKSKSELLKEQKESVEKAKKATGRGRISLNENEEIIVENNFGENNPELQTLLVLSGVKKLD